MKIDAHLAVFEEDAASATARDLVLHPGEFLFEEFAKGGEGILSEEKEALRNAGLSESPADGEKAPEAASVFVDVGGEGAVFFLLPLDADEHGDGLRISFDFALDDDFGTAAIFFIKADPDAFHFDMISEEAFLTGFEGVGEPGVDLALGDGDAVPGFGGKFDELGDAGGIALAILLLATGNIVEILALETLVDSEAQGADEGEGEEDEKSFHEFSFGDDFKGDKLASPGMKDFGARREGRSREGPSLGGR